MGEGEDVFRQFDRRWCALVIPNTSSFMFAIPAFYGVVLGVGSIVVGVVRMVCPIMGGPADAPSALRLLLDGLLILFSWWLLGWHQAAIGVTQRRSWTQA